MLGRAGILLPAKNAFDFVEKPEYLMPSEGMNSLKNKGNLATIKKTFEGLRKTKSKVF